MSKRRALNRTILKFFGREGMRGFQSVGILFLVLGSVFAFGFVSSFEVFPVESGRKLASRSLKKANPKLTVVVRNEQGGSETQEVEIPELSGRDSFENEDFKVVLKKDIKSISLDEPDEILRMKAATVFFHSVRAKQYFKDVLKSKEVASLGQVIIRLEHTNVFSELGHYANDNLTPQYNNATSVPPGKHFKPIPGKEMEWGAEMWFRPRKEIPIKEILAETKKNPMDAQVAQVRNVLYPFIADLNIRSIAYWLNDPKHGNTQLGSSFRTSIGTLVLAEVGFQLVKGLNRLFIPHHYYIDSALVPEIIYHEFTHIALNTVVGIKTSTPLNEGLADYFAAKIANSPKLGARIRDYSTARMKNGKSKKTYDLEYELLGNDSSDFVLSVLWNLDEAVGDDREARVVYEARHFINPYTDGLRGGLTLALRRACKKECEFPTKNDDDLIQYYIKYGFMKEIKP